MMKACLILKLSILIIGIVHSQNSFYTKHFNPKEYNAAPIIWNIQQDARGLLFMANNKGVLIFDGSWKLIPTPTPVRSLFITKSNQILVGCKSDFGILDYQKNGSYYYKSWRTFLNKQDQLLIKDVEKIYQNADATVYITDNVVFRAVDNGQIKNFQKFVLEDRVLGSGMVNNKIWININGKGLHEVDRELKPVPGGGIFKDQEISGITQNISGNYYIATYEGNLYVYDGNFRVINTSADAYLKVNKIYDITAVGDNIGIATMKGGAVYVNRKENLAYFFNKENGFPDNDMYSIFSDRENNLWLGHGKGLSKVGIDIPVKVYTALHGLQGRISDILHVNGITYVSTSQGVFYIKNNKVERVGGITSEAWYLLNLNNSVLVATNQGVFDITGGSTKPVVSNDYTVKIIPSVQNNYAYVLALPGLYRIKNEAGWKQEKKFNEVKMELNSVEEESEGKLWAGTAVQGVFLLEISDAVKISRYDTSAGLPEGSISVFKYQSKIYFKSKAGIYHFQNNRFQIHNELTNLLKDFDFDIVNDKIWIKNDAGYIALNNGQLDSIGYHNILQQKPDIGFATDNMVFLGFADVLLIAQKQNSISSTFQCFIREVKIGKDSVFFGGNYLNKEGLFQTTQQDNFKPSILYSQNQIHIELGTNSFINESANRYKYIIEGLGEWSDWQASPIIQISGISEGNYILKVIAKNAYGQISEPVVFEFKVLPPWYRSIWTYLLAASLLAFAVYWIIRYNSKRLEAENRRLDNIVKERTAQVEKQKQEIEQAYNTLKSTQEQLVQSEKMAFLGQLVAGIAHEINTPIGAVNASATNINKVLPLTISKLPEVLKTLNEEELKLFNQMTEQILGFNTTLTSREERQFKKELSQKLETMGVDTNLSAELVKVGLIENIEKYKDLFSHPKGVEIVNAAANLGKIKKNVDTIETAVAKTQKIVFALKSYSYKSHDEQAVEIDVAENMRTILTIYGNQLKHGVELITNFEENLPMIKGWPDELSQVWTNIIHNALQAMDNKGKLQIDILKENNGILVKITDSGPGIPKEIQDKIFQPFFTTKKQGEGSGLGLDICRKIVEKHKGKIWVDSEPGRTTFLVWLPL